MKRRVHRVFLFLGGVLNLALAILHISFWSLLDWPESLEAMSPENRAILQVSNLVIIWVMIYFAIMSFYFAWIKRAPGFAGKSILLLMAGFYLIRLIAGYPFFGISGVEFAIWNVCVVMIYGYLAPLFPGSGLSAKK